MKAHPALDIVNGQESLKESSRSLDSVMGDLLPPAIGKPLPNEKAVREIVIIFHR